MSSIRSKLVNGVLWESVGRFSALGIQFAVTIIIARILSPVDFGIIGLLTVFIALGSILLDSGFSQALVQKKDVSELDLSSVFFINMIVGVFLYSILFFLSPLIARFYNLHELTNYARLLFLIIPINSFGLIQNVIIQKELTFRKTAMASIVSAIISGIVGIYMAYFGFGIWALIWQQIALNGSKTLLLIIQKRWVPVFSFSVKSIKEMFNFSVNLMLHSIVNTTMRNIYALVIGRFFPIAQVGYYNQATKFEEVSAGTISQVILKVSFPAMVQKKDDSIYLRRIYSKIFTTSIFVVAPLMIYLICVAESLFRLMLTDKWLPAVSYFQILCLYGMVLPALQISYSLYKLFKKGLMLLIIDSLRHLLVIASIIVTIRYGIGVMLYGLVFCTIVMTIVNLHRSGILISLSLSDQLNSILPIYFVAGIVGVFVYLLPKFESDLLNISYSAIVFSSSFFFISKWTNLQGYTDCIALVGSLKNKLLRHEKS